MYPIISELRQKLEKFKSWIKEPRLYIVEELDAIKNEVDIFAERFLMRASKSKAKSDDQKRQAHDKINSNRRQMIDEVDAFQKRILAKMPTNELEAGLANKLKLSVEKLDEKMQEFEKVLISNNNDNTPKDWSDLEHAIDVAIYEFDCSIKQKSSLLFINVFLLKKALNSHTEFNANKNKHQFRIKQSESEMERDEKDRDEDEVEFNFPNAYAQLDAATMFGVLLILDDDCISKEEFT